MSLILILGKIMYSCIDNLTCHQCGDPLTKVVGKMYVHFECNSRSHFKLMFDKHQKLSLIRIIFNQLQFTCWKEKDLFIYDPVHGHEIKIPYFNFLELSPSQLEVKLETIMVFL
jgi:hypothetical protein